ncbi:alpha-amylase family protein [Nakamurella leprariae]|uniref:Alpha-amylase family protein n=1 Tax=Nakamurella leprariae TaxID=2803911 RepID=A0A939C292_9ACTN|nr:alpha-amylase family protein [Nakamurella leprariae]MBM9467979.1 alpha-amylase family protein [Nakamurella leprariae]
MSWTDHVIWWHVYPLGFTGAPIRPDGPVEPAPRLRRLLPWLDHALELGASGLALGPVFASQTHGYDTVDHFRIDPRLGDDADFDELIAQCRARGLRVLLDGVFNHVGAEHPLVRRALAEGPDGEVADWFRIDWSAPDGPRPAVFEGHGSLVALNHETPAVRDHVGDVLRHWLDRGADGWRLDAAYAVDPAFWAAVLPGVRDQHPDAWFVGEVIHGDHADIVRSSGLDSVTQYELWKAIWSSLADRNCFELDWTLRRHGELLTVFRPATFVGNHDVTRIATTVGPDAAVLAAVVLLTVGGIPSIYAGDEHAFTGTKEDRLGGDDAVRPEFPEAPDQLAEWGAGTFRAHQQLIGIRRRHPWLVDARTETVELTNTRYVYRAHASDDTAGDAWLQVELDVTGTPAAVVRDPGGTELFATG